MVTLNSFQSRFSFTKQGLKKKNTPESRSQKTQLYVLLKKNEREEDESACRIVMSLILDTQECGET